MDSNKSVFIWIQVLGGVFTLCLVALFAFMLYNGFKNIPDEPQSKAVLHDKELNVLIKSQIFEEAEKNNIEYDEEYGSLLLEYTLFYLKSGIGYSQYENGLTSKMTFVISEFLNRSLKYIKCPSDRLTRDVFLDAFKNQ